MGDPRVVRANERYKMIAGVLAQLGTALFAAGVVKAYYDGGTSLEPAVWILMSIAPIWASWKMLGLLEAED